MLVFIRKDLIRRWRSPAATLAMIAFPLFMSGMIGMVSGGGGSDEDQFPPIKILLEDRDGGLLTEFLKGAMGREEVKKRLEVTVVGAEGRARMEKGDASALVIFPERFTDDLLAGRPAQIEVVRNPAEGISPEIVDQGVQALAAYLDQLQRLLGSELDNLRTLLDADQVPASATVGALAVAVNDRLRGLDRYLFPPLIRIESVKQAKAPVEDRFNVYGYILIMTTVMALLFVAARSVGDLFEERKSGMLRRQMASPADLRLIVGAKIVFGVVFGLLLLGLLAAIGLALRWLKPPIDIPASLLLGGTFSLAACGVLSLVFALVRTEKQAGILGWLVIMGMSALGGSMINIENMPPAMRSLSPFTLNYWVIDGFKQVVFGGAHPGDVANNVAILAGAGVATTLAGYGLLLRRSREMKA
jgi:ABC-2 type transport system permease protein